MKINKLVKFAEIERFRNVFQPSWHELSTCRFPLRGSWGSSFFGNSNPIIVELGCGKGEYTVNLAEKLPGLNFIGIDIKGSRIYTGAKIALDRELCNVAFVRTKIENSSYLFGHTEVEEIWLTFPDPQMENNRRRLTSTRFLKTYSSFLKPGGIIHLKTDSAFLYNYTGALARLNRFNILQQIGDLYALGMDNEILSIRTFYEKQWLERGIKVKYLSFRMNEDQELLEPGEEFEKDSYRSFGRNARN